MQAVKQDQQSDQHVWAMTYIPHKGTSNIWKGEILSTAANQHALPAPAEHDIHPPFIVQEAKAP